MAVAQAETQERRPADGARAVEVRRRANLQQGQALEFLGHAVEYVMDSYLFVRDEDAARSSQEAIQILKQASRAVFAECAEVLPVRRRVTVWLARLKRPRS